MKVPNKSNSPQSKQASLEKLYEREVWYKLVVKVISWKESLKGEAPIKANTKITAAEWDTYYQRVIKTNVSYDRQRVLADLEQTRVLIEKHGGFASD